MLGNARNPIVLVGLGVLFAESFQGICLALGNRPDFLFDNDDTKWGKTFFGIKCITLDELLALPRSSKLVLTTRLADRMCAQFTAYGFDDVHALSFERSEARIRDIYSLKEAKRVRNEVPARLRDLAGSWCYISGASRGIGAFVAKKLAESGVNLVLHARRAESLDEIKAAIEPSGVDVVLSNGDFASSAGLNRHCAWIEQECPSLDFAYINAGISLPPPNGTFHDGTLEAWAETYQINVLAPWSISRSLLKSSKIRAGGKILFVSSSITGRLPEAAYACSKAGLNKLVNDLSRNAGQFAVEFCLLDPGWISTDMGGPEATHSVETLFPGILFPVHSLHSCNGSWISVQDYQGYSIEDAIRRAHQLGDFEEA